MAYDVVKTIGGRQYRYRVASERDATTGKTRNRWTYLGRVTSEGDVPKARAPRANARLRLLAAAELLLERGEPSNVTADAIAATAGVAHGTFYRYFRDRADALASLAQHWRETRVLGDDTLLRDDVATREQALQNVRRWIEEKLRTANARRNSVRAWHTLIASDARLAAYREERRASTQRRLGEHIRALIERGFADVTDAASTAIVLMALFEGVVRMTILESDDLDEPRIAAVADAVERTVFGR